MRERAGVTDFFYMHNVCIENAFKILRCTIDANLGSFFLFVEPLDWSAI